MLQKRSKLHCQQIKHCTCLAQSASAEVAMVRARPALLQPILVLVLLSACLRGWGCRAGLHLHIGQASCESKDYLLDA